jgi:hypothetical protein
MGWITQASAVMGMLLGSAGFAISLFNYLRDRPVVRVVLQWDMSITGNPRYDHSKFWGIATVTNVGRRPVFITTVGVELPKGSKPSFLLLIEAIEGRKLSEGDQPVTHMIEQDQMKKHAHHWAEMRAVAIDSAGRKYKSKRVAERPSWATVNNPKA